ncbi:MAG: hypothetical protein IJA02_03170 [Clostridia bacterium]|nr:hypothetical protein [Clostridia bacterium]MBR6619281.1 hypothetical protein [Clostridia bacterium]
MRVYKKPEIEIVEFDINVSITDTKPSDDFGLDLMSDEVFYGDDTGYLVNNN